MQNNKSMHQPLSLHTHTQTPQSAYVPGHVGIAVGRQRELVGEGEGQESGEPPAVPEMKRIGS